MYLLDTNIVSELRKGGRADANVRIWASQQPLSRQFLSAITVLELETGILQKERRDPVQGGLLRRWLEQQVLPRFENRILPVDLEIARRCACLHVPDPRSDRDALIAATALVHDFVVVTRNVPDFAPTGVRIFNPWQD
ncbi:MAG TPA: type II toxin-antitoxin system VapC family toxin [Rhodocyclaceae bacterium]|nr:type II toxin-antitoxin system VapC family toxin [Rhodocyclaceae bacterium]HNE02742.1 type II toxin-antitoxin system VapC family toxin [Plasticicumulans sp.]